MATKIDWKNLAEKVGSLRGNSEVSSSLMGKHAIELMLGEAAMRDAVDHYTSFGPGREIARQVLWEIRPWSAMLRCREIFRNGETLEDRRAAVELLRVVADRRALHWVEEFLHDPDPVIQSWGIGVVDQLIFSRLIEPGEAASILDAASRHANPAVRERVAFIEDYLRKREAAP